MEQKTKCRAPRFQDIHICHYNNPEISPDACYSCFFYLRQPCELCTCKINFSRDFNSHKIKTDFPVCEECAIWDWDEELYYGLQQGRPLIKCEKVWNLNGDNGMNKQKKEEKVVLVELNTEHSQNLLSVLTIKKNTRRLRHFVVI